MFHNLQRWRINKWFNGMMSLHHLIHTGWLNRRPVTCIFGLSWRMVTQHLRAAWRTDRQTDSIVWRQHAEAGRPAVDVLRVFSFPPRKRHRTAQGMNCHVLVWILRLIEAPCLMLFSRLHAHFLHNPPHLLPWKILFLDHLLKINSCFFFLIWRKYMWFLSYYPRPAEPIGVQGANWDYYKDYLVAAHEWPC